MAPSFLHLHLHLLLALLITLIAAIPQASAQAQYNCSSQATVWSLSEVNLWPVQNCTEALGITINFGTWTKNWTSISFPHLQKVYGSLSISFSNSAQLNGTLSFPSLSEVGGKITVTVSGSGAYVGMVSFPALENVFGSGVQLNTAGSGGAIETVYFGAPEGKELNVGGNIYITSSSNNKTETNRFGNITFEGLATAADFNINNYGALIGGCFINKQRQTTSLYITSRIYINTQPYYSGAIGPVEIYGVSYALSITIEARYAPIESIRIEGSTTLNLRVVSSIYVVSRKYTNDVANGTGVIGHVAFERVWRVGGLGVAPQGAKIAKVTVNAESPGLKWESVAGDVYVASSNAIDAGFVENVYFRGLSLVRGNLRVNAYAGQIGDVVVNNVSDPCPSLRVDGSVYVDTSTNHSGQVGDVTVNGLALIYGSLSATIRAGSIKSFTARAGGSCLAGIEVAGNVVVQSTSYENITGSMGPVTFTDIATVYSYVLIYPNLIPLTSPITVGGNLNYPMNVQYDLRVDTINSPYFTRCSADITFEYVGTVNSVTIYTDTSSIGNVFVNGHPVDGLTVKGQVTISGSGTKNETRAIDSVKVTNIAALSGGLRASFGAALIGSLTFEGLPQGCDVKYIVLYGSSTTLPLPGAIETFSISNIRSVYTNIDVRPYSSKFGLVSINGYGFNVGGYIYISFSTTYVDQLLIDGVGAVSSYVGLYNNLVAPGGLVAINTNSSFVSNASFTIGSYLEVKTNTEVHIGRLLSVGNYMWLQTSNEYPQLPLYINGSYPGLDVFNYVRVISYTTQVRTVTIDNLRIIRGGTTNTSLVSLSAQRYLDAYRTVSSYGLGPAVIDGRDVVRPPPFNGAYSTSAKTNDPDCVNFCYGRGYGTYNATNGKCQLPCTCWPFNNGTYCEVENVCDFAPTCDCRCGQWSSWNDVSSTASYRNRTKCSIAGTGLSCSLVQLQGSVECTPDAEYQTAEPTPTSFRTCSAISPPCSNLYYQYELHPYTATSDRVCTNYTVCQASQYISVPGTATTDRTCTNWTTCGASEFIQSPGSLNSDVVCQACTNCGSSIVLQECTATTDTICKDCSPCDLRTNFIEVQCVPDQSIDTVCTACKVCNNAYEYKYLPCTSYKNTNCLNYTICDPFVQYQKTAGTPTTDRFCADLTFCDASPDVDYESKAPTATSDRQCSITTACTSGEYQTVAPTYSSNRVCQTLTAFDPVTQYIAVMNTPTTDRVVKAITACTGGSQYQTAAPTPTSDRRCANATVCTPVAQYQTVALTATSDRRCNSSTPCQGTDIEYSAPTATSDRVCVTVDQCTGQQYESKPPTPTTQRVCTSLTVCGLYQFQSTAPTPTTNRGCTNYTLCAAYGYESTPRTYTSDPVCTNLTVCASGLEYQYTAATVTSDRICGAITDCNTCGGVGGGCVSAMYMVKNYTSTSDRVCADMTDCGPVNVDQYQTVAPTLTSNRACANLTKCVLPTYYQSVPGTLTTNRQCKASTSCVFGEYEAVPVTATADRTCKYISDCTENEFEYLPFTATSDRVCRPLTECLAGEFEAITYSETSDRVCQPFTVCFDYQRESGKPGPYNDRECVNDFCNKFSPCGNSSFGNCTNVGKSSFTCSCNPQYYGKSCSFTYPNCSVAPTLPDACVNGGVCFKIPDSNGTGAEVPYCGCSSKYRGATCADLAPVLDNSSSSPSSSFLESSSFLVIAIACVAVLLVAAILFVMHRAKVNRSKHNSSKRNSHITSFENPHFVDVYQSGGLSEQGSYFKDDYYSEGNEGGLAPYDLAGHHGDSQFNPAYIHQTLRTLTEADLMNQSPTMKSSLLASPTLNSVNEEADEDTVEGGGIGMYDNVEGNRMVAAPNTTTTSPPPSTSHSHMQQQSHGQGRGTGYLTVEDH